MIGIELAKELVDRFLAAQFSREERHRRRVEKIKALEQRYQKCLRRESMNPLKRAFESEPVGMARFH